MTDDSVRTGAVQLTQASGEAAAERTVVAVDQPPDGGEIILPSPADRVYDLRFDPRLAEVRIVDADGDGDLDTVLVFNAGTPEESRIVFVDMVEAAQDGAAPLFQVGEARFGADLVVRQAQALAGEQPTLETAAAEPPPLEGTGTTEYSDDFGHLDPLLVPQGVIPPVDMSFPSLEPEVAEDPLTGSEGVLVVGSDADDVDGQQDPHTVPNPGGDPEGPVIGTESADVLVGDPGGSEFVGQFNVAMSVDVTGSVGPDDIETLNAAVDTFVQQIIDRDLAERTVLRLNTFAVNSGQATSGLEFAETFEWDGSQFVAAGGQTLSDAIDAEVANPVGNTNFEPPLRDAAGFFNGLNGGAGPDEDDVNRIFFLTDGQDNAGAGADFDPARVSAIYGPAGLIAQEGLEIEVFGLVTADGLNSGLDPDQLNLLNDGLPPQPGDPLHPGAEPPVDQVESDIAVIGFDDLDTALSNALLATLPDAVGGDEISGGGGNDIIFGDVPDTDSLALDQDLDLPAGSGWFAFVALEAGQGAASPGWDRGDTVAHLRGVANQSDLIGAGRGDGDTVDAGAGNDTIFGQGGDDGLTGGPGADTFVYTLAANEGDDQILDFSTTEGDRLSFLNVTDIDGSGTLDIGDVVDSFVDGGGAGGVDTVGLTSGTTVMIADLDGTLTDLASIEANSLINGAMA